MKTKNYLFFALASLLMLGCNKEINAPEELQVDPVDQNLVPVSFKAVMESDNADGSKTELNISSGAVSWAIGDAVKFIYEVNETPGAASSEKLKEEDIDNGTAQFTAVFLEDIAGTFAKTDAQFTGTSRHLYAVYPSSIVHDYSNASTLYVTVPSTQDGEFESASIALAKWNKNNPTAPLQFNNLCGLLQFVITDDAVRSVVISSGAALAGKASVTFDAAGKPTVKSVTDPATSITINVSGAGTYYAAVLPTELTDVYVSLYDAADGGGNLIGDRLANNSIPVARRQIRKLGTLATGFSDRFYVKSNGTGEGTSWDDAASYSVLSTVFASNTTKKVYIAGGTYSVTEQIAPGTGTTSANMTILGGFPSYATGYSLAGRNYVNNPTVLDAGGACRIWIFQRGSWSIDGITFQNAYRKGSDTGSALVFEGNSTASFNVKNCTFIGNRNEFYKSGNAPSEYTSYGGGAVRVNGSTVNMTNCYFFGNTSDANGGAIFVNSAGTLNATGCIFGEEDSEEKANTATVNNRSLGACVYVLGTANLTDCGFYSNENTYRGGAVALKNNGKVTLSGCTFKKNTATIGGAIYVAGITDGVASLDVDNCLFDSNTASGNGGGAIGISGDSKTYTGLLNIRKCKFNANSATSDSSDGGGAVWANGAGVTFTDCAFTLNTVADHSSEAAKGGGAVFTAVASAANRVFFDRCFFANNSVGTKCWGHHICASTTTGLLGLNNCVIRGNWGITRSDGTYKGIGSMFMSRTKTVVVNTTIFGRVGNPMITQGDADENGFSFINSIAINGAGTPNCFYNYDTAKYLKLYYTLYSQFKDGSNNTTADANCLSGILYSNLGWTKDGNGSSMSVDDVRGNFYYYDWPGSIEGKTVVKPTLDQVKALINGTTSVGEAFLSWLGDDNLSVDIRGAARNTSAMWPGSYEGASAQASATAFNLK